MAAGPKASHVPVRESSAEEASRGEEFEVDGCPEFPSDGHQMRKVPPLGLEAIRVPVLAVRVNMVAWVCTV